MTFRTRARLRALRTRLRAVTHARAQPIVISYTDAEIQAFEQRWTQTGP